MEFVRILYEIIPLWLVGTVLTGITLYWYLTKNFDYWKRAGIPYVPAVPLLGSLKDLFTTPLHELDFKWFKENGRVFGYYEGMRPVLRVSEPEILRNIYAKDFSAFPGARRFVTDRSSTLAKILTNLHGEDWKRVRSVMTPAFSTGKIKRMTNIMIDSAKTLICNFKAAAKEGKPIDVKSLFGAFTMDVIASSAFATKIDSHNDPKNPFVVAASEAIDQRFPWRILLFFMFPGLMRLLRIQIFAPGPTKFFEDVTLKIVEERRRSKKRGNDFLQLMIDAVEKGLEKDVEEENETDRNTEIGHEEVNENIFKSYQSSEALSDEELVAQCLAFFFAGYFSTRTTLSLVSHVMAVNQDIQNRLIAEIDEVIREKGELNYETIYQMKYLDSVIAETLRIYPPGIRAERVANEDYRIKDDLTIPKGTVVTIPVYTIHHDPQNYPDPEKFDPDRFSPEQKSERHPYAYIPFGAGPRNCVAMRFALMEMKVCLAYVLSQCRFSTCSKTQIPLKFSSSQGLLEPGEVILNVEIRNDRDDQYIKTEI